MARKKNPNWTRGKNITVSDEAHSRFSEYAFLHKQSLRKLMDELAAKISLPSR